MILRKLVLTCQDFREAWQIETCRRDVCSAMKVQKAQLGCLIALLIFAALGVFVEYFGKRGTPDDDEGGGRIGALGVVGLGLFFVIFGAIAIVQFIRGRFGRERRGFPVEPTRRDEES